jgi:hypothetical protein
METANVAEVAEEIDEDPIPPLPPESSGMTMIIPVIVNGTRTAAVIDTGSQATMASKTFCSQAGVNLVDDHTITIRGIGNEMGMSAKVALEVPILIGNGLYHWSVLAGDIREDFLIGLDLLHAIGAILDLQQGYLKIGDSIIVADYITNAQGLSVAVSPVVINERTTLPSVHGQSVICDILDKFQVGSKIIVEPIPSTSPLIFRSCVLEYQPHVNISMANLSPSTASMQVGTIIGTAQPVENITPWEVDATDTKDCPDVPTEVQESTEFTKGATTTTQSTFPELPSHLMQLYDRSLENLKGEEESLELKQLLCTYADVFACHDFDLGEFSTIMHRIDTGNAPPVRHGLRRTPLGFQAEEESHLQKMVDHGIIQASASEWAAAPVIVKKKDGKYRYCVDYRSLNKLTRKDSFPLPLIEECLDALANNAFFSTLDMASGYWQILIHPDDRHKTAFITKYGLFEHVRLAMGLCNSPATYQRIMTYVLQNMLWQNVLVYLDDLIILGSDFKNHLSTLEEVFRRFRQHNLKFKPKKCELFKTEVDFLGRRVGQQGISIPDAKVKSMLEWSVPVTRKQLEAFLGFVNYHRLFISNMADVTNVLYRLVQETSPAEPLRWKDEHQAAFCILRDAMTTAPVLAYPNATGMFILDVDASDVAIGAELLQIQEDEERVIAYGSQSLTKAQQRYCTTRKELLALMTFLNHFRFYLLGRYFLVRTDHNSLTWLMQFKHLQGQLARWLEAISQFDFQLVHRPGKSHANADGLSRSVSDDCPYYQAGIPLEQLPCGGCEHCAKMHHQWERFENFVDDVMPLTVRHITVPERELEGFTFIMDDVDWKTEQANDPDLAIVIRWLSDPPDQGTLFMQNATVKHLWRMKDQLTLRDDILFYKWKEVTTTKLLIVVPRKLRAEIISQTHGNVCSGHPGPEKNYLLIRRKFFWPAMKTDITIHARDCDLCCRHKKAKQRPRAPMIRFHAGVPMERIHLDILGPLAVTPRHNKYVLVMVDQFTKWVELEALPDQTADTVARAFVESFICRMGCALNVFTDQGKNFESQLFYEVCNLLQMAKSRTTPYRPSANGQVERMNREIMAKLRIHIDGKQGEWDKYLPFVGMAIRATVNRSTGFTPNLMMLGREVTLPVNLFAHIPEESTPDATEYVQHLREVLQEVHDCAREKLGTALQERKRTYDQKVHADYFETGDLVYLLDSAARKGQSRKLQPVYTGPFLVVKKCSDCLYVITNSRGRRQVLHHDRLRRCADSNIPFWARRERRKLFETTEEDGIAEEVPDEAYDLTDLFSEDNKTTEPQSLQQPDSTDPIVDDGTDLHGNCQVDNSDNTMTCHDQTVPTPEESADQPRLAQSQRSGRQRRMPFWLKDFILERGITGQQAASGHNPPN